MSYISRAGAHLRNVPSVAIATRRHHKFTLPLASSRTWRRPATPFMNRQNRELPRANCQPALGIRAPQLNTAADFVILVRSSRRRRQNRTVVRANAGAQPCCEARNSAYAAYRGNSRGTVRRDNLDRDDQLVDLFEDVRIIRRFRQRRHAGRCSGFGKFSCTA